MSNRTPLQMLFPPGRLVGGSIGTPSTTNAEGEPLLYKTGDKKGQPAKQWYLALAIPKTAGAQHWAQEAWGLPIWNRGHTDFPGGQGQLPSFAWKIEDGDSIIPNKKMKKNAEREGFPGNWIVKLSTMASEPKCYTTMGVPAGNPARAITAAEIKTGYYVEIFASIDGNDDVGRNPGIYINPDMVNLVGFGQEIVGGPDVSQAGFGRAAAPVGASLTPPAALNPTTAPAPVQPVQPVALPPVVPQPVAPPISTVPAPLPVPVQPAPAMLGTVAPPPPGAPTGPTMTAKANGLTRESYLASGWTDELLRAHGMMV